MFIVDCYNGVSGVKDVVLIEDAIDMLHPIINAIGNITETSSINRFNVCIKYGGNGRHVTGLREEKCLIP
jgi:hypothetical protein